jgi:hypothetical protein
LVASFIDKNGLPENTKLDMYGLAGISAFDIAEIVGVPEFSAGLTYEYMVEALLMIGFISNRAIELGYMPSSKLFSTLDTDSDDIITFDDDLKMSNFIDSSVVDAFDDIGINFDEYVE